MNHRWPEIRKAFERLVDLPEKRRQSEIDRLMIRDRALAEEVKALIEADAEGGFPPPPEPLPYLRGSPIDIHEIRRILGEGS